MAIQPTFINKFQQGSAENANIGFGTFLGVETYTKKGVARLTKDTIKVSGTTVTGLIKYFSNQDQDTVWAQDDTNKVYRSTDGGATWALVAGNTLTGGNGNGLIVFDNFVYAFRTSQIDYYDISGAAWHNNWQPNGNPPGLLTSQHFPFLYPSAYGFYFGNLNQLGILQRSTPTVPVDPANAATYNYSANIFTLPSFYIINCMTFLPPSNLVLGTGSGFNTQIADIITWDTISQNKFSPPLRLYSQAEKNENGVNQLINRNNTVYAVTGGNHAIFQTNGTTFTQIAEMALRTNYRKSTGEQATAPVFLYQYPSAIDITGNKLLTGVSTPTTAYNPDGTYALSPLGAWSLTFLEDDTAIQCEYPISSGVIRSNTYAIGAIKAMPDGHILIGWYDGTNYGIDRVSTTDFQNDINTVYIESSMMEIGTPLRPEPSYQNIQINLVRDLLPGQTITVFGRTKFDNPYTQLGTFDTTNWTDNLNALKITSNPLGNSQFLQILIEMSTGSPNVIWSPEIRTVIVS